MIRVRELMTTRLHTLAPEASLQAARLTMSEHRIRHIPVVDGDGGLIGLITQRDLLALTVSPLVDLDPGEREAIDMGIPVGNVMNRKVITVEPETRLRDAAALMLEEKLGCLPVVDDGRAVGILTEADFLKMVVELSDRIAGAGEVSA